jgi:hypothetical protein
MVARAIALTAAVALVCAPPAVAQRSTSVEARLRRAHEQYIEARAARDVTRLATIDGDLRAVLAIRPPVKYGLFRAGYEVLGLDRMVFEGELLDYDGKVLREAHAIDPHSSARAFTLFSTIFPKGEAYVDVPDVAAARAYLREFPEGPFAGEVHLVLAHFHDDLFKVLKGGGRVHAYKRECYQPYVTRRPIEEQMRAAQRIGLTHYRAALEIRPADQRVRESMRALSLGGTTTGYFCAD